MSCPALKCTGAAPSPESVCGTGEAFWPVSGLPPLPPEDASPSFLREGRKPDYLAGYREMKDWKAQRKDKLKDLTLGAQYLAYLLTVLTLVVGTIREKHSFSTSSQLLIGFLLPSVMLILFLDYQLMKKEYERKFLLFWNIVKYSLLFALIAVALSVSQSGTIGLFPAIFLLPVVLASATMGPRWGMNFSAAAAGCIFVFSGGFSSTPSQVVNSVEMALVHGGIYFVLSWFLGGIIEVEKVTLLKQHYLPDDGKSLYQELFEMAPVAYLMTTAEGLIQEANLAAGKLLEVQKQELEGMKIQAFFAPDSGSNFNRFVEQLRHRLSRGRLEFEAVFLRQGSGSFPAAITVEAKKNFYGKVTGLRWVIQDLSLRRQAESEKREKELAARMKQERDLLARVMEISPAGVLVVDRQGLILCANDRAREIMGELRGDGGPRAMEMVKRVSGELEKLFQQVMKTKAAICKDEQALENNGDGRRVYLSVSGAPVFNLEGEIEQVVLTLEDITIAKKMSEEIIKADRLETLELLAGGIAHDFKNYMAVIMGHISLLKVKSQNHDIKEHLDRTEKVALRAKELTRKLLAFAKGGEPARKIIYLQDLLQETADFALSGSSVVCQTQIEENLWPVEADEAQIGQVINNLLINAVQSMPEGGKVELRARNIHVDPEGGPEQWHLPPGDYVEFTITDEGEGIPPELLSKIYDPFFSTKPQGSGLGLATAKTIVHNHGGFIRVESQRGVGTTFAVYLPASNKLCLNYQEENEELYFGQGRVLVMDDEESVLQVCGDMLKHLGKQAVFAYNGIEAVEIYKREMEAGNPFDVVVMDLTVPGGVGGKEAVKLLRSLDPGVKVIVSSGYSEASIITEYQKYGFAGYINKPYRIKELSSALRKVMEK